MSEEITIRPATAADVPDLVRLRRAMFEAMGCNDPARLAALDAADEAYFAEAVSTGAFHGWLAVTPTGEAVSGGGFVIDQHPPGPNNLSGRIGYIMNLVTVPAYRRQGIARRIMRTMLEWLDEQGVQRAALHFTATGRSLYEELGFVDSNEMKREMGR